MKRISLLLILAMLLFTAAAYADNTGNSWWMVPTPAPTGVPDPGTVRTAEPVQQPTQAPSAVYGYFRFRGGVYWNMTPEQVQATENVPLTQKSNGSWTVLFQEKASVSTYTAQLAYMFRDGLLQMINYDFVTGANNGDFAYLSEALNSVYGTWESVTPVEIYAAMNQVAPGRYTVNNLKDPRAWHMADGTRIYLYWYSDKAYAILYVSPSAVAGTYNVNGL